MSLLYLVQARLLVSAQQTRVQPQSICLGTVEYNCPQADHDIFDLPVPCIHVLMMRLPHPLLDIT